MPADADTSLFPRMSLSSTRCAVRLLRARQVYGVLVGAHDPLVAMLEFD